MTSKAATYEFLTEPFHCDFTNRIAPGHLGNHLLNAADFHSNDRHFGMHYLNTIQRTWVLSRFCMELTDWPEAYTPLAITTWVQSVMRFFTHRNFKIEHARTGQVFGYGRSIWAMIDTETRQPASLFDVRSGEIKQWEEPDLPCPIASPSRIQLTEEPIVLRTIDTQYSDVDINGHINSVKYLEHVLNLWPISWHKEHKLQRIEAAYVAESHGGDRLQFACLEQEKGTFVIKISKRTAHTPDPCEVCRCKVVFIDR